MATTGSKKIAIIAVIVVIILIAGGFVGVLYFSGNNSTAPAKVVTYSYQAVIDGIDPSTEFADGAIVLENTYQSLTFFNSTTGTPEPLLATSWTSSPNGTHWVFTLRQGVQFHDGTQFNASAVVYSVERTLRINQGAAYIWANVNKVYAVSQYQVAFNLSFPTNLPLVASSGFSAFIISPNIRSVYSLPSNETLTTWFDAGHEDGTGPYYLSSYDPSTQIVLKEFNNYWGGWNNSQYNEAIIQIVSNPSTREQMVTAAGSSVVTNYLPYNDIGPLMNNSNVKILNGSSYENLYGMYNTQEYPTNISLVREALSYAWPYQEIVNDSLAGYGTQSVGPIPASMWGHDSALQEYTYNLTKAAALLAEAGFPNGKNFPSILLTYTAGDPIEETSAQLFQYSLSQIGVNLTVKALTTPQKYSLATSNPATAQNIIMFYWWPTYPTPYDWLSNCFGSYWPPVFNLAYWNNTSFNELINQAYTLEGTNVSQAIQLYYQAQQILMNNTPSAFLFDMQSLYIVSQSIQGFSFNPGYQDVVFFYNLYS